MKKTLIFAAAAAMAILSGCAKEEMATSEPTTTRSAATHVVINEIKVSDYDGDTKDFIELFYDGEEPINLNGYRLRDGGGGTFIITQSLLMGAENETHVVFTEDESGSFTFGLGKSGETVILFDENNVEIDRVSPPGTLDDDVTPAYARVPDGSGNWQAVAEPTKGETNDGETIVDSEWKGQLFINEIKVSTWGADTTDFIELYYAGDSGVNLRGFTLTDANGGTYSISVPILLEKEGAWFYTLRDSEFGFGLGKSGEVVTLLDPAGKLVDRVAPEGTLTDNVTPVYARIPDGEAWFAVATPTENGSNGNDTTGSIWKGRLFINEIKAADSGTETRDFIELYSAEVVNLEGFTLTDAGGGSYTISTSTILESDNYLEFWEDTFNFGLGKSGEVVTLLDPAGKLVDRVAPEGTLEDHVTPSWSRFVENSITWEAVNQPTPGAENTREPLIDPTDPTRFDGVVFINEIKVSNAGTDTNDWIELYTNVPNLDLSGLVLTDGGGGNYTISDDLSNLYSTDGHYITFTEGTHFSFGLSKTGESVKLSYNGHKVDFRAVVGTLNDNDTPSYARFTTGWKAVATPTKNEPNADGGGMVVDPNRPSLQFLRDHLFINEVKVSDDGSSDKKDWIELYNNSGQTINIGSLRLVDGGGGSYTIPAGTTMGAFKTFTEDTDFDYGLGKNGEKVVLYYSSGNEVVDEIQLPNHDLNDNVNPAWGRVGDGTENWMETDPTKGSSNVERN